jgi:hypothetical protein
VAPRQIDALTFFSISESHRAVYFAHPLAERLRGVTKRPGPRAISEVKRDATCSFQQASAPAAFACRRRVDHHALAGKVIGERIALGTFARKSRDRRRLGDSLFGRKLVLRRAGFQFFEGERQLIDQPRRALRALPLDLT